MRVIKTAAYGDMPDIGRFPPRSKELREDPIDNDWKPIGQISRGGRQIEVESVYTNTPGFEIVFADFREAGTERPLDLTEAEEDMLRRGLTQTQYFNEPGQEYEH